MKSSTFVKRSSLLTYCSILSLTILFLLFSACKEEIEIPKVHVPNEELIVRNNSSYDIVILGAGAGGIGAAYALKDSGLKVLLIDRMGRIGGTHINAWINVFAESVPPVFFKSIVERAFQRGLAKYVDSSYQDFVLPLAPSYNSTYLPSRFTSKRIGYASSIYFDVEGLLEIYREDFIGKIDILLNSEFVDIVKCSEGKLSSIKLKSSIGDDMAIINANFFIDCTDGQIVRKISKVEGEDFFLGEDAKSRYLESYGFSEMNSVDVNTRFLSAPTLIYRLERGSENLNKVKVNFAPDALIYGNQNGSSFYVNSVHYLGIQGIEVINNGEISVYNTLSSRTLSHWRAVKEANRERFKIFNLRDLRFSDNAPMLGVRETYRIACERMLNENSLYNKLTINNYNSPNILEKVIAIGSHSVDIHGNRGVNALAISKRIKPYGVPFGCIIPKKLKNVLIASKASGMTHIAASSFRLNKNIMNLGYAAGKAALLAHKYRVEDVRDIPGDELLLEIEILKTLQYIENIAD